MILPDRVVQRDLGAWPVSGFAVSCDTIALRNPVSHLYASRVPPVQESDRGLRIRLNVLAVVAGTCTR